MPQILKDMDRARKTEIESLRVGVINNIHSIYQKADKMVVLDSLALQIDTGSLIDVAVILSLGRWIARMWTVVEARLGNRVLIKTANGEVDLDEIVSLLEEEAIEASHRYGVLLRILSTTRGKASHLARSGLHDLVEAFRHSHTGDNVDRVRAAFPLLGLRWEAGWGQEEASMANGESLGVTMQYPLS
ncbi:uncharacterized protein ColSpa_01295 [Colletotrichum spaethianum]|uniref:Uncharacterized protein n=1 Tax=Colletotrichum spaethianum TaxID=700344 RepID=A0AA37L6Y1_9PEZI|nr:uncharacterized protein ColSpa_01295 [Colletotrichum spaethianum]GKT41114.1 hypothetical protein ColSpa_01295 [Colletotrichum spaethianum]